MYPLEEHDQLMSLFRRMVARNLPQCTVALSRSMTMPVRAALGAVMSASMVAVQPVRGFRTTALCLQDDSAWLTAKALEKDVVTLPSGLMYKVLASGTGKSPKLGSPCLCHYEGRLTSGKVFDSSIARGSPATFAPNQVISGWTQALQLMKEGDKWELYIPPHMAYGSRGAGNAIPPNAALTFTLELIQVK